MPRPVRSVTMAAAGAAAAYLLDPRSGAERRRRLRASVDGWRGRAGGDVPEPVVDARPADATGAVPRVPAPGTDTPTGTDPAARYTGPGYEDVSFGQATARDAALADRLVAESAGDLEAAERRFGAEAVGAEVLARRQ